MGKKIATVPGLHQHLAWRAMIQYFGCEFAELPELNEEMFKWGDSKSPEYACLPVSMYLGYQRELAKQGVRDFFVYGGRSERSCRYNDLFVYPEKILREEGYKDYKVYFWGGYGGKRSFAQLQEVVGDHSLPKLVGGILVFTRMLGVTDNLNNLANYVRPREVNQGDADKCLKKWLEELKQVKDKKLPRKIEKLAEKDFKKIKLDDSRKLVKLAFTGDFFKVHEPFMHFDTIKKLNKLGVEVKQPLPFSLTFIGTNKIPTRKRYRHRFLKLQKKSRKYLESNPASFLDIEVGEAIEELEDGAQGIIHFQTFSCIPDIISKPIYDRIGKDYNVPVLHYMRDTHASDTAYQTRLEAFVDLIKRKQTTK